MDLQRLIIISTFSIIGPLGVIFNTVVIITLFKAKLLTARNYLIYANLACCDVINAALGCAFGLSIFSTGNFVFCKCLLIVTVLAYTTSVSVIALLSFDRYLMLRSPLRYSRIMTTRFTTMVLVVIWIVSLINATLLMTRKALLPISNYISLLNRKNCVITRLIVREYLIIWSFLLIVLPMLTTLVVNVVILKIATTHYKQLNNKSVHLRRMKSNRKQEWNIKAALTTVRIVVTNVICTLPFVCVVLVEAICEYCLPYKTMKPYYSLSLLNFCSTVVNPILYTITNKELKRKVKKVIWEIVSCLRGHDSQADVNSLSVMSRRSEDFTTIPPTKRNSSL